MHLRDACGAELAAVTTAVDLAGKRVLELGHGDGHFTTAVATHAAEVHSLAVHHADALDVERRRFDLALCGWSL